jgi:hypothetical protein
MMKPELQEESIALEALRLFSDTFRSVGVGPVDRTFATEGARKGTTLLRKGVPVVLHMVEHEELPAFSSSDLEMPLADFSRLYIAPAVRRLARRILSRPLSPIDRYVFGVLPIPAGADMAAYASDDRCAVRYVRQYDIQTDAFVSKISVIYGDEPADGPIALQILMSAYKAARARSDFLSTEAKRLGAEWSCAEEALHRALQQTDAARLALDRILSDPPTVIWDSGAKAA